jgi:lipid-A-disaccharide synthase
MEMVNNHKFFLIAGEASGDLHASNLMKALKKNDTQAEFYCYGGNEMLKAGGKIVRNYRDMAYMGFLPVILHARTLLKILRECKTEILNYCPDAVILIDYPSFNLNIARFVKKRLPHTPVFYYISPKIWAWKKYRIKALRLYVDKILCIFPFETDFYKTLNCTVNYVGNPSVDAVSEFLTTEQHDNLLFEKPIIAILAGSRKAEVANNLPIMLKVAAKFTEYKIVIAGAPGLTSDDYNICNGYTIIFGHTYDILKVASAALVTSGTATLEAALFRVPQVVCYHIGGGFLSNFIFKRFFHISFISLVNLIAGQEVVKELYGGNLSETKLHAELKRILEDDNYKNAMLNGYKSVLSALGTSNASQHAATLILDFLHYKST